MLDEQSNREIFARGAAEADIAIVEGMMGLFDGVSGGGEKGSAAEIAKLLSLPVILVLDASKSARSLAAVIHGFETFDPQLGFAGLVLNQVAGESHFRLLREAIQSTSRTPLLGWLPRDEGIAIPERHLGLRTADEESSPGERTQSFAAFAEKHLDLDRLLSGEDAAPQHARTVTEARPGFRWALRATRHSASTTRTISICCEAPAQRSSLSVHSPILRCRPASTHSTWAVAIPSSMQNSSAATADFSRHCDRSRRAAGRFTPNAGE